ncbi:MAG: hypothetical protein DWQ30_19025 [Acidobacteria bacterium]|nr:MAG: hypothetical protein DWQ30_19025 [Acidobacteriota bacterium]
MRHAATARDDSSPALRNALAALAALSGLVVLPLLAASAAAVPLETGRLYPGGTVLEVAEAGLSFSVPDGYKALLPAGSEVVVMTADDRSYVLAMADAASLDEARAFLSAPLPLGGGVVLQPSGDVRLDGAHLAAGYTVSGSASADRATVRAREVGGGIVAAVFAVAASDALAQTQRVADAVLASVERRAVASVGGDGGASSGSSGSTGSSGSSSDAWQPYLQGMHLVRFYTGSGYQEEQHLYLCSDGTFHKSFESGGHTSYGEGWSSGATQNRGAARWHATGVGDHGTLFLQHPDGSSSQIVLEYRDEKVFLDGKRWLRDGENPVCN